MKKAITLSIILTGFTAMASQIVYMRELLVVFYGNELSISFILAGWLISGALGSAVFGRFSGLPSLRSAKETEAVLRPSSDVSVFAACQIVLGLLLIMGIAAAKFIKIFLRVNPGEVIGLFPIIVASFAILAPICILMGFIFPLACRIRSGIGTEAGVKNDSERSEDARGIGGVYILEAIGSIIGGAITSFVLIKLFDALHIAAIFACLNFFAAFLLISLLYNDNRRSHLKASYGYGYMRAIPLFLMAIVVALWSSGGLKAMERYALQKQWHGYEVLDVKNSVYGNILMARRGEDYSLFNNGMRLYTIPDKLSSEEAVHPAMLEDRNPKRVLLIGGGVGGLIEEILKHRVERVDYVELDPSIIEISMKNLPGSYYKALKDPRVSIKNTDGRFFVKNSKELYDCIIIHAGDPYTAQENRYYTAEFFNEVRRMLKEGGIISFGLTSSESYISKSLAEFLRSIYATLRSVFNEVIIMPGERVYFLASNSAGLLTYDYKVLEGRTIARGLDTRYVRDYYLFSKLSPENIAYFEKIISNSADAVINHDLRPAAYYYGLIFWTTLFRDSIFSKILKSVTESVIWRFIAISIILLAVISIIRRRSFRRSALIAVMTNGFSSIAFQLLILLTFQTMYGYLFYELGIIFTAFMAGLAMGALFVVKVIHNSSAPLRVRYYRTLLIAIHGDFIIFSLLLSIIFSKFCPNYLFPILSVIAGSIGGAQFAIANQVLLGRKRGAGSFACMPEDCMRAGRVGGLNYGMDLLGSFFGALLTGVFLIPILGIPKTCLALALINAAVLALLFVNMRVEE